MNWTCPHCQKHLTVSDTQLRQSKGIVVCPQCLSSERVPGYDDKPLKKSQTDTTIRPVAPDRPTSSRTNISSAPPSVTRPVQQKKKAKKTARSKHRGFLQPHSALGCLWRSVVFTAVLLAVYIVVGWLLNYV